MDDVDEYIERFAGYLRLLETEERIKPRLDGEASEFGIEVPPPLEQDLPHSSDPFSPSQGTGLAPGLFTPRPASYLVQAPEAASGALIEPPARSAEGGQRLMPHGYVAPSSAMWDYDITIKYFVLGSQLIHIRQVNVLEDGDTILANPDAGRPGWANLDTEARRATLLEEANQTKVAAELVDLREKVADPETFPAALQVVLDEQTHAPRSEDPEAEGPESWLTSLAVESEGIWIDGVWTETPPERPDFSERERSPDPKAVSSADLGSTELSEDTSDLETGGRNGLERPGMEAELGGNLALSSAAIRDYNDVGGTLLVMGDVHDLSLIWQTNILSDVDEAHLAGPVDPLTAGTNALTNFAHFQTDLSLIAPGAASSAPLAMRWNVDVVKGNLIDFNMLIQHNVIRDGDLSVQHAETGFQRFVLGSNQSVNVSDLMVLRDYYDVIFVGGDMVRANMIFQYNFVIDDDAIRVIGNGAEGTAGTLGGGNTLWNEALILRNGTDVFTSFTKGAWDFLEVLEGREETLDEPPDLPVLAGGSMPLRVLFVEGDYFDVNAIAQTNEIHDADAALQLGVGEMSLSTGGNTAANVAQIFDFRGQGTVAMLEGEHYDDEMLIQTNILSEAKDVRIVDAQTLASEVIAFLDPDLVAEPDADGPFKFIPMHAGDDMMSGMMA